MQCQPGTCNSEQDEDHEINIDWEKVLNCGRIPDKITGEKKL
jgi:hypothetical protein